MSKNLSSDLSSNGLIKAALHFVFNKGPISKVCPICEIQQANVETAQECCFVGQLARQLLKMWEVGQVFAYHFQEKKIFVPIGKIQGIIKCGTSCLQNEVGIYSPEDNWLFKPSLIINNYAFAQAIADTGAMMDMEKAVNLGFSVAKNYLWEKQVSTEMKSAYNEAMRKQFDQKSKTQQSIELFAGVYRM